MQHGVYLEGKKKEDGKYNARYAGKSRGVTSRSRRVPGQTDRGNGERIACGLVIEEKSHGSYFEIHFYFDSVQNYDNNRSVDMYIGNHFSETQAVLVAGLQKRISLAGAARCFPRKSFHESLHELSFLSRVISM